MRHIGVPSDGDDKTRILGVIPPPHTKGITCCKPNDVRQTDNVAAIALVEDEAVFFLLLRYL